MGNVVLLEVLIERIQQALLNLQDPVHLFHLTIAIGHLECVELMMEHAHARRSVVGVQETRGKMYALSNSALLEKSSLNYLLSMPVRVDGWA